MGFNDENSVTEKEGYHLILRPEPSRSNAPEVRRLARVLTPRAAHMGCAASRPGPFVMARTKAMETPKTVNHSM